MSVMTAEEFRAKKLTRDDLLAEIRKHMARTVEAAATASDPDMVVDIELRPSWPDELIVIATAEYERAGWTVIRRDTLNAQMKRELMLVVPG